MGNSPETSVIVEKAIKIVNFLSDNRGPQSLKTICENLELTTTIGHRLLTTLKNNGMVYQDDRSKLYSLGWAFLEYTNKLLAEVPISPALEPWLIKLRDLTQETVGFYVPYGPTRICVLECESTHQIRRTVGVGSRLPIHLGAGGITILANMNEDEKENLIGMLSVDKKKLQDKLNVIAQQGYYLSEEETAPAVAALAAPVFDARGRVIGSLSISGPLFRWNEQSMQPCISELLNAARGIQESLHQ